MSNALDDHEQQQICALGRLGWPLLRIQRATGVRRETVSGYLKAAGIPVRGRGRPSERKAKPAITEGVSTDSGPKPAIASPEVSTDSAPTRAPSASACAPYRELIEEAVGRGRNAVAIYQDLVDDHGFTAKYASVKRFVAQLRGTTSAEARVVMTTAPGEEGQVDYGEGPMVRWPATGKYRRTRLFVFTLACSRKAVRLLTWRSSTQIWCELHERAFRRLGGTRNALHVRLIHPKTGQLLREHLRATRGWHRIDVRDQPTRTPSTTLALLGRATTAGPSIGVLCRHLHAHGGAQGIRQVLGVLALAKKHGVAVVDDAAKTALDVGVLTYRFVRKYIERRPPVPLTLRQIDPLIRQLTLYRDLVDQKTGGSE